MLCIDRKNFNVLCWKDPRSTVFTDRITRVELSSNEYHLFYLFSYLSFFFIVKQLDLGNRFTNWIRSLVEITRYFSLSLTHTQIYSSKLRDVWELLSKFFDKRFSSSSYHFTKKSKASVSFFTLRNCIFLPPFLKLSRVTSIESANSFR